MDKVDLHMHTIYSDGTDDLDELLKKLQEEKIGCFSITDHDTIAGSKAMLKKNIPEGMYFIPGVEFSCITAEGEKCHILGYDYDPDSPILQDIVEMGASKRREKFEIRLQGLKEKFGIEFSEEDLNGFRQTESVGKPHLAKALIRMGLADNKDEAIQKYLNPIKTGSTRLDAETVIKAINASGGISVWAHPLGGEGEKHLSEETFKAQLDHMIAYDIRGLECWYSKYNEAEVQMLIETTCKNNLLISGGSDYHGKNKTVKLGTLNNFGFPIENLMIKHAFKMLYIHNFDTIDRYEEYRLKEEDVRSIVKKAYAKFERDAELHKKGLISAGECYQNGLITLDKCYWDFLYDHDIEARLTEANYKYFVEEYEAYLKKENYSSDDYVPWLFNTYRRIRATEDEKRLFFYLMESYHITPDYYSPLPEEIVYPDLTQNHQWSSIGSFCAPFKCVDDGGLTEDENPVGKTFRLVNDLGLEAIVTIKEIRRNEKLPQPWSCAGVIAEGCIEGYTAMDRKEKRNSIGNLIMDPEMSFSTDLTGRIGCINFYMGPEDLASYNTYPLWQECFRYCEKKHEKREQYIKTFLQGFLED